MQIFRHLVIVLILSLSFPAGLRPAYAQEADPATRLQEMLGNGSFKFYNRLMQPLSLLDLTGKLKSDETRVSSGDGDPIVGFRIKDSVLRIQLYNPLQINESGSAAPLASGTVPLGNLSLDSEALASRINRTLTLLSARYAEKTLPAQGDLEETTKETRRMAGKILLAFSALCVVIGGVILMPELWKTYQTFKGFIVESYSVSTIVYGSAFVAFGLLCASIAYVKLDD